MNWLACLLAATAFSTVPGMAFAQHGGNSVPSDRRVVPRAVAFTELAGASGVVAGGYGGWMILPGIVVGGGGFAFVNEVPPPLTSVATSARRVSLGSGGFFGEILPFPSWRVLPLAGVYVGGASATYQVPLGALRATSASVTSSLFVVAPRVGLEFYATRRVLLEAVGSYRFVTGPTMLDDQTRDDLTGARVTLTTIARF